jgi:hypothetical protein
MLSGVSSGFVGCGEGFANAFFILGKRSQITSFEPFFDLLAVSRRNFEERTDQLSGPGRQLPDKRAAVPSVSSQNAPQCSVAPID